MKVESKFSPITVTLETEDEVTSFAALMGHALADYDRAYPDKSALPVTSQAAIRIQMADTLLRQVVEARDGR